MKTDAKWAIAFAIIIALIGAGVFLVVSTAYVTAGVALLIVMGSALLICFMAFITDGI